MRGNHTVLAILGKAQLTLVSANFSSLPLHISPFFEKEEETVVLKSLLEPMLCVQVRYSSYLGAQMQNIYAKS